MRFLVVGVGGVGGYFGACLATDRNNDVYFVARGETLKTLQTVGLRVDSIKQDIHLRNVQVTTANAPSTVPGPVDCILVAVKTWQIPTVIDELRPLVSRNTVLLPLQNGITAPTVIKKALQGRNGIVTPALCKIISFIERSGHIRHTGVPDPSITFGDDGTGSCPDVLLQSLASRFAAAGIAVSVSNNIQVELWEKLMLVGPWGGVGAVTRSKMGDIRATPETFSLLLAAQKELYEIAVASGVKMTEKNLQKIALIVKEKTPHHGDTSMQRDILAGRPSELEAWLGDPVRLARDLGVPVPTLNFLYHSLLPQEKRASL